jgi:hypothetical protein
MTTSFQVEGYAKIVGIPTDGIECFAYAESRFGTPPSLGSPVPDTNAADAGPILSSASFGSTGKYVLNVPDAANYWVGCYLDNAPWQIAWSGPKMATPHTSKRGWTNAAGIVRGPTLTTTSGGGITLPVATINVVSTTGFAASGQILVKGSSFQLVTYTATTGGTSFTGCSGGSGTILNGAAVIPAYPNLTYRRLLFVTVSCTVTATGQNASATLVSTVSGAIVLVGNAGITTWSPTTADQFSAIYELSAPVDPGGVYGLWPQFVGGSVGVNDWVEVDF